MNNETWQQLLSLESRDLTQQWFNSIHGRELNARRAKEINSAAKQAREYFRNAAHANYAVKPLLTFYGVASLSRALLLLMKKNGGEEGLTGSHGLETVGWGDILSGEISTGLRSLRNLKIRTTSGLFNDFITHTNNRISLHVNSSAVDWRLDYVKPATGDEFTVDDLFSRIPDLQKDYSNISQVKKYSSINQMKYTEEVGFSAKISAANFSHFSETYEKLGYRSTIEGDWVTLTCESKTFKNNLPMFIHTYIGKTFGTIPSLHLTEPFPSGARYSQLCLTYMVSYFLGMFVRYYPTYWMSLSQGDKGDSMWPTINRAQQLVEHSFPELVIELIYDILDVKKAESGNG
ncbi:YaaC family protein [Alteromonas flava]|uniref:YaaC family protein n=1 Tax=Alteromonas flava TaxID=2048003 RepID=UPI000C28E805|nr:YaaC family protein [Alteromonas flava]